MHRILGLILISALLAGLSARAQPAAPAKPAVAGITAAQAQSALQVLTNDAKRQELVSTLETIVKAESAKPPAAQQAAAAPGSATPAATGTTATTPASASAAVVPSAAGGQPAAVHLPQLLPGSLGAQLMDDAANRLADIESSVSVTMRTVLDLPLLSFWFTHVIQDTEERAALLDTAWRLALVLVVAIGAEYGVMRLLRRPGQALEQRAAAITSPRRGTRADDDVGTWDAAKRGRRRAPSALLLLRRLPFVLGGFVLDLMPILVVVLISYVVAGTPAIGPSVARLVISSVLYAYAVCRLITTVTR
ncbi:MAG TPA: hypothetical protein VHS58_13870, partial [Acetobacteraceae bacterium]|nr:hypothetical protein [Acetobacteraceae bacterium]